MSTIFTIAYRCYKCGKLEIKDISLFQFSGKKTLKISCNCGNDHLSIHTRDFKNFMIHVKCIICNKAHIYNFSLKEIKKIRSIILYCNNYNIELCFIGERDIIIETVDKYQEDLEKVLDELGYDDYFVSNEIMLECLNILHDYAEKENILCQCGRDEFYLRLLPARIELLCKHCGRVHLLPAGSRQDIEQLKHTRASSLIKK